MSFEEINMEVTSLRTALDNAMALLSAGNQQNNKDQPMPEGDIADNNSTNATTTNSSNNSNSNNNNNNNKQ